MSCEDGTITTTRDDRIADVTPSVFDPRLEYTTVAETGLSDLDGENGELVVVGYPIEELAANASYEETLFLLFEGRLPTADELADFRTDLASRRELCAEPREVLRRAADEGCAAMEALRMGVATATLEGDRSGPQADAKRAVAVLPTIAATYWRYRQGDDPVSPTETLDHTANYLYMLTGEEPSEADVRGLETFLTTLIEHGMTASTFTARTVVSTESDIVSATTAALGTLKGPRHAGDLGAILELLRDVHESGNADAAVDERLAAGDGLKGFGHPVYRVRDPRAAVLSAAAERFFEESAADGFLASVREFEAVATERLREREPTRDARATVEFYAAALLDGIGIPKSLFPATFAISRAGGWTAHCLEQLEENQLVRPTARYVGTTGKTWTPVENRHVAGDSLVGRPVRSASLEPVSETLAVLSEPNRLEILLLLYDADEPLAYSALRRAASIEDKGRFNYHLRQLREYFVTDRGDGYELTDAGRTFVRTLLTEDRLLDDLL
ncbi:citrate/2-methylcitrate synthase [Natrinema gari]|uniref:Citrate synthase n=1 Tax=Natrinema gari JCM 14663 TaxID=1230459 RepID=L9Z147_9EURY|nr:citrate/2-methylcitrate synthase [Natrinema gari]ELY80094.1 citrate synthase [Natrinema gari JCM 14663]